MLWAEATIVVRWKNARSASSWSASLYWRFVVERLMLMTSKRCSIAQRRPASITGARAGEARTEDAHRGDLRVGRERADDAGARGAVPAQVALVVVVDLDVPVLDGDRPRVRDGTDPRVAFLDAAVEDADAHAAAGGLSPGPVARDVLRPGALQTDVGDRPGGKAPRGKRLRGDARLGGHDLAGS